MATLIQMNYANSIKTKAELEALMNLYAIQFKNYPANVVNASVMNIISNDQSPFPPTIAKIKANIKMPQLLESENAIMKKYDEHYDDQYNYRKDEMKNRILHNPYHIPDDEMKSDFKKCIGIDYEAHMNLLQSYLNGAIPKLMKGEL